MIRKIDEKNENKISGGAIFNAPWYNNRYAPFEVINDKDGEVMLRCPSMEDAKKYAHQLNQSSEEINWDKLCDMRRPKRRELLRY